MPLPAIPAILLGPVAAVVAAPALVRALVFFWLGFQLIAFLGLVFVSHAGLGAILEITAQSSLDSIATADPLILDLLEIGGVFEAIEVLLTGVSARISLLIARFGVGRLLA